MSHQTSDASLGSPPRCPACMAEDCRLWAVVQDREYYTSEAYYRYYRCDFCDIIFIFPIPVDRLAEIYPPTYYSFGESNASLIGRAKELVDRVAFRGILGALPQDKLAVLDVGGGTGWLLDLIKALDCRVVRSVVVDIDSTARDRAVGRGHDFILSRFEALAIRERFDLILMLNLIEHVERPKDALRKARDLLCPQGILVVKTPNIDSLDARVFRGSFWGGLHAPRHWVLFSLESFVKTASSIGLKVVSAKYTQGAPFWASSLLDRLVRLGIVTANRDAPLAKNALFGPLSAVFAAFDFLRRPFAKTSQMIVTLKR